MPNPKGNKGKKRLPHADCLIRHYRAEGHLYPEGTPRPCRERGRGPEYDNLFFCSSCRGCLDGSHFLDDDGNHPSYKSCDGCRNRSVTRTKKTPDEKAKAKTRGKAVKNLDTTSKVTKSRGRTGALYQASTPKLIHVLAAQKRKEEAKAAAAASRVNIGNFLTEPDTDDETLDEEDLEDMETDEDEHPYNPGYRRTPDDEDDKPGQDGTMGGGLTGTLIAA
nr:uncharacterized protein CTRU02_11317 [Colletotrichum truncatum]KAF6786059.1 hypothetical protein CTRU02_11317 [Colletotrichum truncatum]